MSNLKQFVLPDEFEIFEAPWDVPVADYPVVVTMEISADVAKNWERHNKRNRIKRDHLVTALGRDVANGDFQLNGETIKYSRPLRNHELKDAEGDWFPKGTILQLDGQHRIQSCANSGVSIRTGVYFGLEPDSQHTVDLVAKRKFGDALRLRGEKHSHNLATITRGAWLISRGDHYFASKDGATQPELMAFLESTPALRRAAEVASSVYGENSDTRVSVTGIAYWMFADVDENEAAWFMQRLGDGAHMAKSHPVKVLERKLRQDKSSLRRGITVVTPQWMVLCYYINCWNKFRELGDRPEGQEYPAFMVVTPSQRDKKEFPTPI